eukprot:TRINITY_DN8721_c0_g1_i4.p2 TRINITY_DN8721_c0_g1~~TRINITY_DN8721_c0_g1_i4.p2  ORF type:complete len:237 (+),score=45.43 TRINITY_DN8721_c0_g1_i4:32-712(+)
MTEFAGVAAIIVAAGGQTTDGPPQHVRSRLDRAVELYLGLPVPRPKVVCTASGTPHKPSPLDEHGFMRTEAQDNAAYLISKGVDANDLLEEGASLDTIGNAYYARVLHTDVAALHNLVVITSAWHLARTQAVFDFVFGLPSHGASVPYTLKYIGVENDLPADILASRAEKEAAALPRFLPGGPWQSQIASLQELHRWLFREHSAYASSRLLVPRAVPQDAALLKSY